MQDPTKPDQPGVTAPGGHRRGPEHPDYHLTRSARRRARAAVFVDRSGRRRAVLRRIGPILALPILVYLGLLVSTFVGGPTVSSPLLPEAPSAGGEQPAHSPAGATSPGTATDPDEDEATAGEQVTRVTPSASPAPPPTSTVVVPSPEPTPTSSREAHSPPTPAGSPTATGSAHPAPPGQTRTPGPKAS